MKILCVDDDHLVRAVTCDLLRDLGHEVAAAAGYREAIGHLENAVFGVELLITDVQMNGPEGTKLAAVARDKHPGLPVIYFTGHADFDHGGEARSALLLKPCTLSSLEAAITRLCGH